MKTATLASLFALGDLALAARLPYIRASRQDSDDLSSVAQRMLSRTSQPLLLPYEADPPSTDNTTHAPAAAKYRSPNWAGAVYTNGLVTSVTGTITVPSAKAPAGGAASTKYCMSPWVGIDGASCKAAILQTGVDVCVQDGRVSVSPWYEWYPDNAYAFDLAVSPGDVLHMTVTASSDTAGVATIENQTTGKSVSQTFDGGAAVKASLCRADAEWIVEDFMTGSFGSPKCVPFADFGSVTFSGAQATVTGQPVAAGSYTGIMDIQSSDGKVMTDCSAAGSELTCKYV